MQITNPNILLASILFDTIDTKIIDGKYYGTSCIIKQIANDLSFGIKSKALREIMALKKNKHTNIIKMYDVKYDMNHIYIILEKGDKNLLDLTKDEMTGENIIKDISLGLKTMHLNNYIHGDLSLKNVVRINNNGTYIYKLIDFGSSNKIYRKSALCEPTIYISPVEILNQKNTVSSKVDSWALGCVAYYVMTGTILFIEETKEKLLNQIFERFGINNSNTENKGDLSIGKILKMHSSNNKIIKSIKKLLNVDFNKRYTVTSFYDNTFNKTNNKTNFSIYNDMENMTDNNEIFKPDSNTCSNVTRSKMIELLLLLNIQYNIPIENIFLTFKLLHKMSLTNDEYILNGIILYSLTTKLVSHVQLSLEFILNLINMNCNIKIKNTDDLNIRTYSLLDTLNWDIDVQTLISCIPDVKSEHKLKYLEISLVMLSDVKYDIFSGPFGYKIITILLECLDNMKLSVDIDNKYKIFHVLNDVIVSLHRIKDLDITYGKIIKTYFKFIGIDNFSEWVSEININKIKKLILNHGVNIAEHTTVEVLQ